MPQPAHISLSKSQLNRACRLAARGLFYSPKAARSRWRPTWKAIPAFCRVMHWTVRCTTGQPLFMSGAWSPSISGAANRCSSGSVGAPSTVRCTPSTVWCTPDSPVHPADRWSKPRVARWSRRRPLALAQLAHRTVRWILATSPFSFPETDEFVADDSPDSLVIYSRITPSIPESSRFNVGQPGAPDSPVCQAELELVTHSQLFPISFLLILSLFLALIQTH
jgi:hypothetical protein